MSRFSKFADGVEKWINSVDRYLHKNKANIGYIAAVILCGILKGQSDFKYDSFYDDEPKVIPYSTSRKSRSKACDLTYYGSDASVMTVMAYYDLARKADWDSSRITAARNIKDFFIAKKDDAADAEFLQSMSIRAISAISSMMDWESDKETCVRLIRQIAEEEV